MANMQDSTGQIPLLGAGHWILADTRSLSVKLAPDCGMCLLNTIGMGTATRCMGTVTPLPALLQNLRPITVRPEDCLPN